MWRHMRNNKTNTYVDYRPYAKNKQAANSWSIEYMIRDKKCSIQNENMDKNILKSNRKRNCPSRLWFFSNISNCENYVVNTSLYRVIFSATRGQKITAGERWSSKYRLLKPSFTCMFEYKNKRTKRAVFFFYWIVGIKNLKTPQ